MYSWRKMTEVERLRALDERKYRKFPKHTPPHFESTEERQFLISGACYEHQHLIGKSSHRMSECEAAILNACDRLAMNIYAWCVLPNHYHVLLKTDRVKDVRKELGLMHGRLSHQWNGEDNTRGRQVWHNCFERGIKSDRHYWASLNYVHHNPVHHGYVQKWQDWPWSSAKDFIDEVGREKVAEIWETYPLLDYGKKWDVG
jgi:putative transposase